MVSMLNERFRRRIGYMSIFKLLKRRCKRSDWLQGVLEAEKLMKSSTTSVSSARQSIGACMSLDIYYPEYCKNSQEFYDGKLSYLKHYESFTLNKITKDNQFESSEEESSSPIQIEPCMDLTGVVLEDWARYVATDFDGLRKQYSIRPFLIGELHVPDRHPITNDISRFKIIDTVSRPKDSSKTIIKLNV